MSYPRRAVLAATTAAVALGLMACSGGGASDEVGAAEPAQAGAGESSVINLYAYAVPKVGFDKVIPAFTATPAGAGVEFRQSYGA